MAKATITRKIGFLHIPKDGADGKPGADGKDGQDGKPGADGKPGQDGKDGTSVTITRTAVMYAVQKSGTELVAPAWSRTIPNVPSGMYLWTRTAVEYSDGTETISYSVSRNASDGLPGKTYKPMRIRDWEGVAAGETLYEGSGDDDPWTDMVVTRTPEAYYRVVQTFAVPSAKGKPSDAAYQGKLQASSQFKAIATELLLAKSAVIRIMSGNRVIVLDSDGVATAGLSGSLEGKKTRIFAGGAVADEAPFRVAEDGSMHSSKADIEGTVTARTMRLGVDAAPDGGVPDGALCFCKSSIKLPELPAGVMASVRVYNPKMTRTTPQPLTLTPATTNVLITNGLDWTSATSAVTNIARAGYNGGVYGELMGYNSGGLTYWGFVEVSNTSL